MQQEKLDLKTEREGKNIWKRRGGERNAQEKRGRKRDTKEKESRREIQKIKRGTEGYKRESSAERDAREKDLRCTRERGK